MSAVITVKILGDDASLKKTLASSRGALSAWDKSMRAVGNAGQAMTTVGRTMSQMVTVPVLATGAAAVKMAYDFNVSMTKIQTLVGATDGQMKKYSQSVLDLQATTGKSSKDLAEALYFVTSSGYKGQVALDILTQSAKASATGLGTTAEVADVLTTAMSVYGPNVLSAAHATDILNTAVKDGKGDPAEMAKELGKVIAPGQLLGVTFDQTAASVALLTIKGQDAATATTGLRQVYMNFLKPAKATQKALAGIGTSAADVRKEIKEKGLLTALEDLNGKAKNSGKDYAATSTSLFSNVRALASYLDLVGGSHSKNAQFYTDTKNASQGAGAAAASFDKWKASVSGKFLIAMGTLKTDLTIIGGQMLPKLVGWLSKVVKVFHDMGPAQKKQAERFLLIAAAIGPILLVGGKLLTTFSLIARHPILTVLALLTVEFIKLYTSNAQFKKTIDDVLAVLKPFGTLLAQNTDLIKVAVGGFIAYKSAVAGIALVTRLWAAANAAIAFVQMIRTVGLLRYAVLALNMVMSANPAVLIAAAIAALVVGIVICYKKFDTFRYIVNIAIKGIVTGLVWLADKTLWVVEKMLEGWGHLPDALGGGKATNAAAAVQKIRDGLQGILKDVNALPTSKTMEIRLNVVSATQKYNAAGFQGPALPSSTTTAKVTGARATGGPVAGGNTYLVGEHGPELVTMGQSGFVSNASATAKMFGSIGKVSDSTSALKKTESTQKTQYTTAARRYKQLAARTYKHGATQAEKDALVNAKSSMDQQKKDYDAAAKAVAAAQKADKALQAQYKKGAPLLTKAAGLVGFGDVVGPVEKQAATLAAAIQKQFADKDGNIPAAAQAAIDRINGLASNAAAARSSLVSSLTGDSDFVAQFSGTSANSSDITTFLNGQVSKIKDLGNDLKILTTRGVPASMIQQLAAGGLAALPIADALARSSSADLAGIVSAQSQINTLSNALGNTVQSTVFGKPDSPTGDLTGTKIKDAPAGTVYNTVNVTANTNASAAQIAADAAWHLRTVSA